jgi:glycosidase
MRKGKVPEGEHTPVHHPGPPQFLAVGESVQLAPRDPDPEAAYRWRVIEAPDASDVSLGDDPVQTFAPDVPGTYVLGLEAPDGDHRLTVRAFPGEYGASDAAGGEGDSGRSGYSGVSGVSGVSGAAGASGRSGRSGPGSGVEAGGESGRGGGRPRIRLTARVEGDEVVVGAEPEPHPDDDRSPDELDVEFVVDDRDPVDEGALTVTDREVRIPLAALPPRLRVHGVALGDSYSVADVVEVRREDVATDGGRLCADGGEVLRRAPAAEDVTVARPNEPPEWATGVTLYEIYVRGFADDDDAESTFAALEERLPYLEDLGVDCLWLTPVLQNDHAPHGYNIVDFFAIAEDLGDRDDYESFVEAAHERGMKVLFDLVLNHSARDHPFFQDAYGDPDSEYYDWYEWREDGEPGTYFDWEYIANFDYTNLEVRRHVLDAVDTWAEVADGFRCDMAWAVPRNVWQEIRERLKARDPEFLLLDETIPYVADFHELCFDVHFDTTLYFTLRQVGQGDMAAEAVLDAVEQRARVGFPDHAAFMLYLENHDETRYIVDCGDAATYAAAAALFTLPGIPMLYAGQELGQRGRRDALAWDHAREEVRDHYERLIEARGETPSLRYGGGFGRVDYDADTDRVVAFRRGGEGRPEFVVVLNFGEAPATVGLDREVDPTDVVSGDSVRDGGDLVVDDVAVLPVR